MLNVMQNTLQKRLDKHSIPEPNTGCLLWFGATNSNGYGHLFINGKTIKAHRLSYELNVGPIKNNICHSCDTPQCINPLHLFDATQLKNMRDAKKKKRHYVLKTHCIRGHEFTKQNTSYGFSYRYNRKYKYQVCKKCIHLKYLKRKAKL